MKRRSCTTCDGTGRVFDLVGAIFTPANWIPFNYSASPYKPCQQCGGRGHYLSEWRSYSPTWRRR